MDYSKGCWSTYNTTTKSWSTTGSGSADELYAQDKITNARNSYDAKYGQGAALKDLRADGSSPPVTSGETTNSPQNLEQQQPNVESGTAPGSDPTAAPTPESQSSGQPVQAPSTGAPAGPSASISTGSAARPSWDYRHAFTFAHEYYSGPTGRTQIDYITLFLNPESFTQTEPSRITVTQTKGGAFVDNFGAGLKTIVIQGITGYKPKFIVTPGMGRGMVSGHDHFIQLRKMYRDWLGGSEKDPSDMMKFYNHADDEAYQVIITQFTLQRAVARPLLYQYNIQMTCVDDLSQAHLAESDSVIKELVNVEDRLPSILSSLTDGVGFITGILSGAGLAISGLTNLPGLSNLSGLISGLSSTAMSGLANLSNAATSWAGKIVGGMQFFDTVSSTYKTVSSVMSDTANLVSDVQMFASGIAAFIAQPFEIVQNLAISMGDIVDQACSLTDVPHEVIRTFRDMMCAIKSMPQAAFTGFTNPSLFEGASNGGILLGIGAAAVSSFRNSFTATAQVPPKRAATQIFRTPQKTLKLKEVPLQVSGVFLETDVSRTGTNYLDSVIGDTIKLSIVPTSTVVVDYQVPQLTTQNMIQLRTSASYVIKSGDTLIRIALNVYKDPSRWKEIVLYNGLEYPFIVEDRDGFQKDIFATGTVRFFRKTGPSSIAITIPKWYLVYAPSYMGTKQINFYTTESAVLNPMKAYVDIPVIAEEAGSIGNVASGIITGGFGTDKTQELWGEPIPGISGVSNVEPTFGGKTWRVAFPGDIIQIPQTSKATSSVVIPSTINYEELLGIDIWVDANGEWDSSVEGAKDLARVMGIHNLVQAIKNRIYTTKGFYPYHAEYGTNLPFYIGKKGITNNYGLIKFDILGEVLLDPRIKSIEGFQMKIYGDTVGMEFDAIPIGEMPSIPLNVII
jgi:hypothetical protein